MESAHEDTPAEMHLQDLLDALEAGLIHLRRERDALRDGQAGARPAPKAVKKKAAQKKAVKAKKKKAVKKAAAPAEATAPKLKEPVQKRMALGKTLSQIRSRVRESG
jgi:hypothetical protein